MNKAHTRSETRPPGRPKRANNGTRRYVQITLDIEPAMIEQLDTAAAADGLASRSEAIRRACASYLRRTEKRLSSTVAEKGKDML